MTKISYCEVSLDPRLPQIGFHDTSIDELAMAQPLDDELSPYLRVFARDQEDALSVRYVSKMHGFMRAMAEPMSALRRALEVRAHQLTEQTLVLALAQSSAEAAETVTRQLFVFDAIRSRLEPIAFSDTQDAWRSAMAMLVQSRAYHTQHARFIVECAHFPLKSPEVLLDVLYQHLNPTPEVVPETSVLAVASERPANPMAAQRQLREHFLTQNWPTSAEVAAQLGSDAVNQAQVAADLRKRGQLLGAWSHRGGTFVHPSFQFDDAGKVRPEVEPLLATLRELTLNPDGAFVDRGGWRRVFWLYGPRAELDERAPADVFAEDPGRVLALAQDDLDAINESTVLDAGP